MSDEIHPQEIALKQYKDLLVLVKQETATSKYYKIRAAGFRHALRIWFMNDEMEHRISVEAEKKAEKIRRQAR